MSAPLDALLFDGQSAEAVAVRVAVDGALLRVAMPEGARLFELPLEGLPISDAFASAPRQITLPGGAMVEVTDGAALTAALAAVGRHPGLVDRLQQRWLAATVSLIATVVALAAGYAYGLPAVVRAIAVRLPEGAEERLGEGVLEVLDGGFLQPSDLDEEERARVERRIAEAARLGAPGVRYRLLFRSMGRGPDVNAFAIPGGTVVLLDGLVERTGGDERLVAVVGHELGHLARRHSTQALLEAAGVGAATSLLWGDFSGQAATVPAVLAMTRYSRDAEREADEDAVRFLRDAGLGASPMLDALCLLSEVEEEVGARGIPAALSTHPNIDERLARVRALGGLAGDGCGAVSAPP